MDGIDATNRAVPTSTAPPPSLLSVIIDTNPLPWSELASQLSIHSVLSTLLVFINAHLAINHANQIAVLASHVDRIAWLYPTPETGRSSTSNQANGLTDGRQGERDGSQANKYPPFATVERQVTENLRKLLRETLPETISPSNPPFLSGAISTALTYANMQTMLSAPLQADSTASASAVPGAADLDAYTSAARHEATGEKLVSRVLVVSVSRADLSSQYISLMNAVFAAQKLQTPIDILRIGEPAAFLQQACDATGGVFLDYALPNTANGASNGISNGATHDKQSHAAAGLLQTLMMAYLPDVTARRALLMPGSAEVDFRAACFCHGKVVDLGGVCSICLSIFCLPLPGETCLTCGTPWKMPKNYGVKPAVVPRKKKKKKRPTEGGRDTPGPASGSGTPAA